MKGAISKLKTDSEREAIRSARLIVVIVQKRREEIRTRTQMIKVIRAR